MNDYGCIDRGELQFFPYFYILATKNDNDGTRHIQIPGRALSTAFWLLICFCFLFPDPSSEGQKCFQRSPSRLVFSTKGGQRQFDAPTVVKRERER